MRIAVNGCTGRIGTLLCRALMNEKSSGGNTLSGGVSRHRPPCIDFAWSERLSGLPECDAVADFSSRECTKDVLSFCLSRRLPLLIGTTGQTEEELSDIRRAAGRIPVFLSPNLSPGMAALTKYATDAARLFPEGDIAVTEAHRKGKADAPSGSARALCERLCGAGRGDIPVYSLRLGNLPGEHIFTITTGYETLMIIHRAEGREVFSAGAIRALNFLSGRAPGLYGMDDLIGE